MPALPGALGGIPVKLILESTEAHVVSVFKDVAPAAADIVVP